MRIFVSVMCGGLMACGTSVAQLDHSPLTVTAALGSETCEVAAYIAPIDEQFATTGITATLNGAPLWVVQGEAAHEEWSPWSGTYHVAATGLSMSTVGTNAAPRSPQPEFLELIITDGAATIHAKVANPCFLNQLTVVGSAAAGPGDTVTLQSDARADWGTRPVPFELRVGNQTRQVRLVPEGNRLSFVVPDFGVTGGAAQLNTTARATGPTFERCEGVANCSVDLFSSSVSVNWTYAQQ